jgi:hypothetical protein
MSLKNFNPVIDFCSARFGGVLSGIVQIQNTATISKEFKRGMDVSSNKIIINRKGRIAVRAHATGTAGSFTLGIRKNGLSEISESLPSAGRALIVYKVLEVDPLDEIDFTHSGSAILNFSAIAYEV